MPSRFRVPVGFVLGTLVLAGSRTTPATLLWGLPLTLLGEAIRLWSSGHIEKTEHLATGGPYAHTRHPLYLGSFVIALGVCVASGSLWVTVAVAVYFLAFYPAVIREEEAFLRERFVDEYPAWAQEVPGFLPRLSPGGPRSSRFAWVRVRNNREWRTVASLPWAAVVLYLRGRFVPWW